MIYTGLLRSPGKGDVIFFILLRGMSKNGHKLHHLK